MRHWRSYENKHYAEVVSEYVNKTMNMFSRFPTKVREKTEEERSRRKWIIEIDDYCSAYKITLEKADACAEDFLAGYEYALHESAPQFRKKIGEAR